MKERVGVPNRHAWLSALALYAALLAWSAFLSVTVPPLLELIRVSPRLAMLGLFAVVVSPVPAIAAVHHVARRALDAAEGTRAGGVAESLWAGAISWCMIFGVSTATSLLLLVLFPPEPEPDALGLVHRFLSFASGDGRAALHAGIFVALAAQLYQLERAGRPKR